MDAAPVTVGCGIEFLRGRLIYAANSTSPVIQKELETTHEIAAATHNQRNGRKHISFFVI